MQLRASIGRRLRRRGGFPRGCLAVMGGLTLVFAGPAHAERARNVILFIGDGMGAAQVEAARDYQGTAMCWEAWPASAGVATDSAGPSPTDSAGAATAIATGHSVSNGVISEAIPGDGGPLRTVLEYLQTKGKRVGLISNGMITDATPAAFAAHTWARANMDQIADDYLNATRPNILFGGGSSSLTAAVVEAAGYLVVTDAVAFANLDPAACPGMTAALFGSGDMAFETTNFVGNPHLWELTDTALQILEREPAGFFLLVENDLIDLGCHNNSRSKFIPELLALNRSVQTALSWASNRTDTLILVTADHETGGLAVLADNGPGVLPSVSWGTISHTPTDVVAWAWGPGSERLAGRVINTNLHDILVNATLSQPVCVQIAPVSEGAVETQWTGASGDVYRAESSPDMTPGSWMPFTTITALTFQVALTDTNVSASSRSFYRLLSLPE